MLSAWGCRMEVDEEKIDDIVLALLYLTTFENKPRLRAWKGHDWDALDRLTSAKITSPIQRRKQNRSVLTEAGAKRSQRAFREIFCEVVPTEPSLPETECSSSFKPPERVGRFPGRSCH